MGPSGRRWIPAGGGWGHPPFSTPQWDGPSSSRGCESACTSSHPAAADSQEPPRSALELWLLSFIYVRWSSQELADIKRFAQPDVSQNKTKEAWNWAFAKKSGLHLPIACNPAPNSLLRFYVLFSHFQRVRLRGSTARVDYDFLDSLKNIYLYYFKWSMKNIYLDNFKWPVQQCLLHVD